MKVDINYISPFFLFFQRKSYFVIQNIYIYIRLEDLKASIF